MCKTFLGMALALNLLSMSRAYGGVGANRCQRCGRTYKQVSSLNRHIRYECGVLEKQHECHLCGKKYYRPDTLQEHRIICRAKFKFD